MSSSFSLALRLTVMLIGISASVSCRAPATHESPAALSSTSAYPLKTCVVSGGKLGGMGKPVVHVHSQAGQADRTVMFCCKACIRKFEKDPARFLAKLDAAEAAAADAR